MIVYVEILMQETAASLSYVLDTSGTVRHQPKLKYPFGQMSVGDSFLIFDYKKALSARVASINYAKRNNPESKFAINKTNEGWRIFRIQ